MLSLPVGGALAGCELFVEFDRELLVTGTPCTSSAECDDVNVCTSDVCGAAALCEYVPVPDGPTAEQEAKDCKVNLCVGGILQQNAFDPTDTFDDSNSCTSDICNTTTWEPESLPLAFESSCDDGAGHTGVCGCVANGQLVACPAGQTITCQISCTAETAATVCADAYFCTEDGFCDTVSGFCTYPLRSGEPLPEEQQTPNDCKLLVCDDDTAGEVLADDNTDVPLPDDNPCTDHVCEAGTPYQLGINAPCDNGVYCDGDDICVPRADPHEGGSCDSHPGDPCAGNVGGLDSDCSESCNEASDDCTAPDPDGSACSDGVYCTGSETCAGGSCGNSTGNPCPGHNVGNSCNDSCNEGAANCTANDANGTSCNDGQYCNGADTCNNGSCAHAGNPCSSDYGDADCTGTCNESSDNCSGAEPNGSACSDGMYCTVTDSCTSGTCGGTGNPCPGADGDGNCSEGCNEGADNCTAADPNGSACTDGLYCNGTDSCSGGTCGTHTGDPCPGADGDADCSELCNEGADDCSAYDPNGSACTDGLYCNGTETCASGACAGSTGNPCPGADGDFDCSETCSESNDNCTTNDPAGSACNDGTYCNGTDTCSSGICSTHTGDPCPGSDCDNDCSESCNEGSDDCTANDLNGSDCGSSCLGNCVNGTCEFT